MFTFITKALDYLENNSQDIAKIAGKYFTRGKSIIQGESITLFLNDLKNACKNFNFLTIRQQIPNIIEFNDLIDSIKAWLKRSIWLNAFLTRDKKTSDASVSSTGRYLEIPKRDKLLLNKSVCLPIDPIERNLQSAIDRYESLYLLQQQMNANTTSTQKILNMMRSQFRNYMINKPGQSISLPKIEEGKNKQKHLHGLKSIFDIYCKRQYSLNKNTTFENLSGKLSHMTIGEFTKFCKDFEIPLTRNKLIEIFKKKDYQAKFINWDQFLVILIYIIGNIK